MEQGGLSDQVWPGMALIVKDRESQKGRSGYRLLIAKYPNIHIITALSIQWVST